MNLNFWRISLWMVSSYLLGWGARLHGTFLILARTTLFLCCTYVFFKKYKRNLNLHQSEFWTFVKLICELWVHFFLGRSFMKHFLFKTIAGLKLLTHRGVTWKEPMGCLRINLQEDKMIPKSSEIGNFELFVEFVCELDLWVNNILWVGEQFSWNSFSYI